VGLLKWLGLRGLVLAVACAGAFASAAGPSRAAVGGSDGPLFADSLLTIDAGGSFIQGRPFEVLATGSNQAPGGNQSDLVPYRLNLYLLSAKVGSCPMTNGGMANLVKQHPNDTKIVFKTPVPEAATGGPGLDGPFTIPLFQVTAGNYTGPLYICGYSTYATEDAAWYEFGPVTITPPIPAKSFPSRSVRLGSTGGCWPLAQTHKEQTQGLTSVRHPARPMLFAFKRPGSYPFLMLGVFTAMNGIWIGAGDTVIGRWHGVPDSDTIHKPPAPVKDVTLYPAGMRLPADGARLQVGTGCSTNAAL